MRPANLATCGALQLTTQDRGHCGVILAYYAVIAGWVVKYLALNLMGRAHEFAAPDYATGFGAFIARPLEPILWQAAVLAVAMAVVAAGVERGVAFLLEPDRTALSLPGVWYPFRWPSFLSAASCPEPGIRRVRRHTR